MTETRGQRRSRYCHQRFKRKDPQRPDDVFRGFSRELGTTRHESKRLSADMLGGKGGGGGGGGGGGKGGG
uniref:Uncharacterized protein n=1 Tax=Vespula pensylvanica TaxID=30213 RepID=A0A834P447_VESPE|nr:hypothetical protein H0235_007099 [Vespula pensylvanica]